jgi:phosphoglycerol transferase MdoB-like AlkP superfamily enzyme
MISELKIPKLIRWIFMTGIFFLIIMSVLRVCFFFFFSKQGNSFSQILPSLLLGIRYDLRDICLLLLLLLLSGISSFLDPFRTERGRRTWFFLFGVAAFLLSFFYSVDFAHYGYLSQRLNASILNYLGDAGISMKMIWQTYPVVWIILLIIAASWFMCWVVIRSYKKIKKSNSSTKRKARIFWYLIMFLLLGLGIFGRIGQFPLRWSDAFALGSDYKANLALNPFQSFFSSLGFRHSVYDSTKVRMAIPILAPYFGFPGKGSGGINFSRNINLQRKETSPMPNVVVIICESFSAYKSSMWGNPLNTTPYFNEMTKQGIFFDRCFTPSYGTARGVWAVITGIPDVEAANTTSSRNPAAVDQHTIISDFKGYDKFYFIGGSSSWANIRGLLQNNIESLHLYEQQDYDAPKIDVWGISDKNLFLEANKALRLQTKPFFAIIQTADNHRPYTIPLEDRKEFINVRFSPDSLKQFGFESNDELNAFRYTDFCYMKFLNAAEKEKYFDNTVFLFVGDHGIPGDADHMFPKAWTDQRLTSEQVPLLLYSPKLLRPRRISDFCSQIDVLPTLAGLCNLPYRNTTLGRDLLDTGYVSEKPFSFIYDPDQGYIGIVKGSYFYREQLLTGKEEMVSVINDDPVSRKPGIDSMKKDMKKLTDAIYESSRYLILNNKK